MKSRSLQVLVVALALAASVLIPSRAVDANYTISIMNATGLAPANYSIYVMGFSTGSNLVLGPTGTLVSQSSGTISSYPVGTGAGQISAITLDTLTEFNGGRFYFFVVANGQPAPSVTFGQQPPNPGTNPSYPPYSIVEITVPAPVSGVAQNATIDIQTVDGSVFPLTIGLNGLSTAGNIYGQPLNNSAVTRASILSAYDAFMQAQGSAGTPYADMVYLPNSINGQAGGILNPGAYLTAQDSSGNYLNLGSTLHTIFNADLNTLFASSTLQIQGVPSNPSGIPGQSYTVAPVTQTYPGTSVSLPALKFTGATDSSIFYVFNPVGVSVLTNSSGAQITGSITTTGGVTTLTLDSAVTGLQSGMFVSGAGLSPNGSGQSTTTISGINGNALTLSPPLGGGDPAPHSQYVFSKQPYVSLMLTPGQMVFGNAGFFADSSIQLTPNSAPASVLASIENYIVSALNRGVGVASGALNPAVTPGNNGTSAYWGTQANWYPAGATQNLFSLFMHTALAGGTPIFIRPAGATTNAQGQTMGSAYGFAYDENGGPVPPAPNGPEVPSKFDGTVTPGSTIQLTLGAWTASTPAPATPEITVKGKKTIKTKATTVKIKGTAVGQKVVIKYKAKPGKNVTKHVSINANGQWQFKFKPQVKDTTLKFYAQSSDGEHSRTEKVKVVKTND